VTDRTLTFRFISEKKAEKFLEFLADEYGLDSEVESYMQIVVPTDDFSDQEIHFLIGEAEEHCGDVLL
jgi:hypothetical protein